MATPTTYNKQQILEITQNKNPLIEFRKPKHGKRMMEQMLWKNMIKHVNNNQLNYFVQQMMVFKNG